MKLLFILPSLLAGPIVSHRIPLSVYILVPKNAALTALASALDTVGYGPSELGLSVSSNEVAEEDQKPLMYVTLPPEVMCKNTSRADPNARFILPVTESKSSTWYEFLQRQLGWEVHTGADTESIRAFFADKDVQ
jgi:hypothetical protein